MRTWIIALFCLTVAVALTNAAKCKDRKGTCFKDGNKCQGRIVTGLKCPPKKKNCCITKVGRKSLGNPENENGKGKPKKCEDHKGTCLEDGKDCQGKLVARFKCPPNKICCRPNGKPKKCEDNKGICLKTSKECQGSIVDGFKCPPKKKNCCITKEEPQAKSKSRGGATGKKAKRCRRPRKYCKKLEGKCKVNCRRQPSMTGKDYCRNPPRCKCCYKERYRCRNKPKCDYNMGTCQFNWEECKGMKIKRACKGHNDCVCCAECQKMKACEKLNGVCQNNWEYCNGEKTSKGCRGPDCVCCYLASSTAAPATITASPTITGPTTTGPATTNGPTTTGPITTGPATTNGPTTTGPTTAGPTTTTGPTTAGPTTTTGPTTAGPTTTTGPTTT